MSKSLGAVALFFFAVMLGWAETPTARQLLTEGRVSEALMTAQKDLEANPRDVEALVIAGTAVLYAKVQYERDASIYRPEIDPQKGPSARLTVDAALAVANYWKRVPSLDATQAYLWGDLSELVFRAGGANEALEFANEALNSTTIDAKSLQKAYRVFALNLQWDQAIACLARIPDDRVHELLGGLEAWRKGSADWRARLQSYLKLPASDGTGVALATYLVGPAMRDTEAGYQAATKFDSGLPGLLVRQKTAERFSEKFTGPMELAQTLALFGNYEGALKQWAEIDRRRLAPNSDAAESVLFQEAWAYQYLGRASEALAAWQSLTDVRDFYTRSAALWFVGSWQIQQGKTAEAKTLWRVRPEGPMKPTDKDQNYLPSVLEEAGRSKYAAWCLEAYKALPQ